MNSGYHYTDDSGCDMVDYHVNLCEIFQTKMNKETLFGGRLSVRLGKDEMPSIIYSTMNVSFDNIF